MKLLTLARAGPLITVKWQEKLSEKLQREAPAANGIYLHPPNMLTEG